LNYYYPLNYNSFYAEPSKELRTIGYGGTFVSRQEMIDRAKFFNDLPYEPAGKKRAYLVEELAEQVGLSLKRLKMGFKQIYGDTVYGFLFDYKMDYARQLLDSGSYNVNEVGLKIGYSTGSHFIAAFKKKFATTPKKYLMSINPNT
jgi:AraC-like DNA-binding protein